jgi:DNA-binding SARP family transcriptional activator/streptogramin lyase
MQFRTLGMLEVWDDGRQLPLGPGRQRAFLALLLLHPNEVVSLERLIEDFWGERAPPSAPKVIQGYVSQLRRALPPEAIRTHGSGYLLHVTDTDAAEFERLLARARAEDPADAARTLRAALALWRGRPLADVEYEGWAQGEISRLEELRLVASEDRLAADLALGLHADVIAELEPLVVANPLRERLRSLLMLALYRCDRQVEALEVYRATRSVLVESLGVEPSKTLQQLEQRILAQDPALDLQTPEVVRKSGNVASSAPTGLWRRRRDASLIAGGALLLAVAISAGIYELTRHPAPVLAASNSLAAIDPKTNRVSSDTAVGNTPTAVAVGAGSVWVLNSNEQTISRIDPGTGTLQRTIPAVKPASDIAVGLGAVWVAGSSNVLARIDPNVPQNAKTLALPGAPNPLLGGEPSWVAADAHSVWATSTGAVLGIAPAPRRHFSVVQNGCCGPIALGFSSVWVADDFGVERLDAGSGARITIKLPFHASGLAIGLGGVWVTDALTNRLWRIDPSLNAVSGTASVGQQPSGVAVGAGSVWVASADGTVSRIAPTTTTVTATVTVGGTPIGIAFGAGRVWVTVD